MPYPSKQKTSSRSCRYDINSQCLRDHNTLTPETHLPPWKRAPTPRRALDEALLQAVVELPPAPRLRVLRHLAHVRAEVGAGVLEVRDDQAERRVVVDGVVGDVVPLELGEDPRPDGRVDSFVYFLCVGLELVG